MTLDTRILDYLTRQTDQAEAADLAFDVQARIDHPLEDVMTGGEVAEMCKSIGQPNLYQTIRMYCYRGTIINRKASNNSLLIDRPSFMTWLVAYQARQRARKEAKK